MIELTEEQRSELSQPEPVAIDPQTKQAYVLVRKEAYDRIKALLTDEEFDPFESAALINDIMAEDDANDPLLESYQHYRKESS